MPRKYFKCIHTQCLFVNAQFHSELLKYILDQRLFLDLRVLAQDIRDDTRVKFLLNRITEVFDVDFLVRLAVVVVVEVPSPEVEGLSVCELIFDI